MATRPIDPIGTGRTGQTGEDVLGETRKLRGLARGLLYDRDRAEDVVQEAWLAALRKPPSRAGSLRAWLATTVRRLAWSENRSGARTKRREEEAARPEALPDTIDSLMRVETLKRVVEAVGELDEPYRETVLLRFFDELTPREIAKRHGVPVETVRTRIRRALALLRRRLDGEHAGARGTLLAALLPMAGKMPWSIALGVPAGSTSLVTWTGALAMSKTFQLAAAAIAVVLLSVVGYRALVAEPERPSAPNESAALEPALLPEEPDSPAQDLVEDEVAPARTIVDLAPATEGEWVVRGHLTRGIDDPYPGGRVRVEVYAGWIDADAPEAPPEEVAVVVADADGDFECPLPAPAGTATVIARPDMPDHFKTKDWHSVAKGLDAPQILHPRAYPIDSTLLGRVVDPEGNAVAGARVTTYRSDSETDEDGRFALPASSVESTIRGKVLMDGFAEGKLAVRPLAVGEIDAGTIELTRGLRVTGRVVDEGGRPVADAIVSSSWMGYGKRLDYETVTTAADGSFELDQVAPDKAYTSISASKEGYVHTSVKLRESPEDEPLSEVEIVLPVGGVVRGHVAYADGTPAEDVWLCVGFSPAGIPRVDAYSDEDGNFEFPNAPSGTQTLWAVREGKRTVQQIVEVPGGGGALDELRIVIEDGHYLAGVVLDENDEPMPWVYVYAEGSRRGGESYVASYPRTDRAGRFRIEGLPGDFITLGFLEGGYSRHEEDFTEFDRDDLVIRMQRAGSVAGRVVDGRTGEPIETFTIRFVSPELEPGEEQLYGYWSKWSGEGMTFAGTDGYWNADNEELDAGKWTGVEATAEGYGPTVATRVQSTADPDPDALVMRLYAGSVVHGRVVEAATGRPVAGAMVKRFTDAESLGDQHWMDEHPYWTETDAEGRFELEQVPAGTMSLGVDHSEWGLTLDGPFEVPEGGAVVERQIAVDEGLALTGRLLGAAGEPLIAETIELQALETAGEQDRKDRATTDENGAFGFRNLLPGLYHVRWVEQQEELTCYRMTKLVEVGGAGGDDHVLLQLEGEATLFGTVMYAGKLPEFLAIYISPRLDPDSPEALGQNRWAPLGFGTIAINGRFELEGLEPGEYSVSAYLPISQTTPMAHGWTQATVPSRGSIDVTVELKPRER